MCRCERKDPGLPMDFLVPVDTDAVALAASLAEVSANLAAYVRERAEELAEPQVRAAREESAEVAAGCAVELAAWRQRFEDVRAELWKQLDVQVARRERESERADATEAEAVRLRALLDEVLGRFSLPGHVGTACLRTGWTPVEQVEAWRAAVRPTPGTS